MDSQPINGMPVPFRADLRKRTGNVCSPGGRALGSEPPPGTLASGEVVYVACGDGKKRKVTGGDNARGVQRSYGECR